MPFGRMLPLGTEDGEISLSGQRRHNAPGPPLPSPISRASGLRGGVVSFPCRLSMRLDFHGSQTRSWRWLRVTGRRLGLGWAAPA